MLPDGGSRPLTPEEEAALAASAAYGVPPPAAEPLVPAGTAAPPTTTIQYPTATAGPPGSGSQYGAPEQAVGYGTQVPSSTPAPAPYQTGPPPQPSYIPESSAYQPATPGPNTLTNNPLSTPRAGAPPYTGPLTNHSSLGVSGPTPSPGAGYSPPTNSPSGVPDPVGAYQNAQRVNQFQQNANAQNGNGQGLLATYYDEAANHARGMKLAPPKQRKITIEEHKDSARRGALRGIGYTPQGMMPAPGTGGSIGIDPINNPQQQPSFATPLPPPPPQTAAPGSSYMDQVMWGAYGGNPNAAPPVGLGLTPSTPPVGDGLLGRGYGAGMDSQLALGGQQTAPIAAPPNPHGERNILDALWRGTGGARDAMGAATGVASAPPSAPMPAPPPASPNPHGERPITDVLADAFRGTEGARNAMGSLVGVYKGPFSAPSAPSVGLDPALKTAWDQLGANSADTTVFGQEFAPSAAATPPKNIAPPRTSADQLRQFGRDGAGVSPYGVPQEPEGKNTSYTPPPGRDAPPLPKGYTADGIPEPGNSNFVMSSFLDAGYVDGGGRWTPAGLAAGQQPDPDLGVVLLDANGAWTPEAAAAGVVPPEAVGLIGSGWAQSNSGGAPVSGEPFDPNATAPVDVAEVLAVEGGNVPSGGYTPRSSGGGGGGGSYGRRSYGGGGYSGGGGGRGGFDLGGSFGSDDFDDSGWEDFLRDFDNDGDMDEKDEAKARKKAAMRKKTRRGTRGGKSRVPQPGLGGVPSFPESEIRTNTLAAIDKSKSKGKK